MAAIHCSFCGEPAHKVQRLISGSNREHPVYICKECVGVGVGILKDDHDAIRGGESKKGNSGQDRQECARCRRNGGSMTAAPESREPRTPSQGDVVLRLYNPDEILRGELVDISPHGFRVRHQSGFAVGREVLLSHEGRQVRARAMWSRETAGWVETGFYIL